MHAFASRFVVSSQDETVYTRETSVKAQMTHTQKDLLLGSIISQTSIIGTVYFVLSIKWNA